MQGEREMGVSIYTQLCTYFYVFISVYWASDALETWITSPAWVMYTHTHTHTHSLTHSHTHTHTHTHAGAPRAASALRVLLVRRNASV